ASVGGLSQLQVVALTMHPDGNMPDPGPGVEPGSQRMERAVVRRPGKPGEAERCSQELAALVEHALLDDLVRTQQQRLRDRDADGLRALHVDNQLELPRS